MKRKKILEKGNHQKWPLGSKQQEVLGDETALILQITGCGDMFGIIYK